MIANLLASIPQALQQFGEEWRRVHERIQTASDDLNEQIHIWDVLAQNATKFSDVVSLAGDGVAELTRLTNELEKAQSRNLSLVETTFNKISQMVNVAAGLDISTSPKADEVKGLQANLTKGLDAFIAKQDKAQAATDKWLDDLNRPPSAALRDISDELTKAEEELQSINRHTLDGQKAYEDQLKTVSRLRDQVDEVGSAAEKAGNQASNFSLKQRQAELDQARLRGEDVSAAEHKLAVEEKIAALTKSNATALKDGRITQDQITALAEGEVTNAEEAKRAAKGKRDAVHSERDARRDIVAFIAEENALLQANRIKQQLVEQNPVLTLDQKDAALAGLIKQEIDELNAKVAEGKQKIADTVLDPATFARANAAIVSTEGRLALLGQRLRQTTFTGQLRASLVQWANQFGSTAEQVANVIKNTLGTAISGTSSLITGLITRTGNWKETWNQTMSSILNNLIQLGLQLIAQKTLGSILTALTTTEQAAAGATIAAANAPAAAATSIASYGGSAVAGSAAAAAAIAAIIAALTGGGGFESGGYTGDGPRSAIAGVVHRGEWVNDAVTVKRAGGPAFFENLKLAINRPGYERGGSVGGGSSSPSRSSPKLQQTLIFFDAREMAKHITKTKEWETSVVHLSNSRGGHLRT